MCSNFQPINKQHNEWVQQHFETDLPIENWRDDSYPAYPSPFIYLEENKPKCGLAKFGLVPSWAIGQKNFGIKKYNARSETVAETDAFKSAWNENRFGLVLMQSFYETKYHNNAPEGKVVRFRIKRTDGLPQAAACIWERVIDSFSGEIIFSFSMLTINANSHLLMQDLQESYDEKRSIVILQDSEYLNWLHADHENARQYLNLAPDEFLESEPAPKFRAGFNREPKSD